MEALAQSSAGGAVNLMDDCLAGNAVISDSPPTSAPNCVLPLIDVDLEEQVVPTATN